MIADPVVIVIDMQNDFCTPGYAYHDKPNPDIQAAIEHTEQFLERYRATGRSPILVQTIHDEQSTSPVWAMKYEEDEMDIPCQPNTVGANFVDELRVQPTDLLITKHRYSAFYNTRLQTILRSNDVSRLIICGVNTNICVASTVHSAFNRDYDVTVLSDCTAATDPMYQDLFLSNMNDHFAVIQSSDDIELEDGTLER